MYAPVAEKPYERLSILKTRWSLGGGAPDEESNRLLDQTVKSCDMTRCDQSGL